MTVPPPTLPKGVCKSVGNCTEVGGRKAWSSMSGLESSTVIFATRLPGSVSSKSACTGKKRELVGSARMVSGSGRGVSGRGTKPVPAMGTWSIAVSGPPLTEILNLQDVVLRKPHSFSERRARMVALMVRSAMQVLGDDVRLGRPQFVVVRAGGVHGQRRRGLRGLD